MQLESRCMLNTSVITGGTSNINIALPYKLENLMLKFQHHIIEFAFKEIPSEKERTIIEVEKLIIEL